jgi:acetoin:2,6-dichlorophenolindophenol oxidoreductase subunit alpha
MQLSRDELLRAYRYDAMMKALFAREGGLCGGKGGSMHIADLDRGMLGANGIVGGGARPWCAAQP